MAWLAAQGVALAAFAKLAKGILLDGWLIGAASGAALLAGRARAAAGAWQPGDASAAADRLGTLGAGSLLDGQDAAADAAARRMSDAWLNSLAVALTSGVDDGLDAARLGESLAAVVADQRNADNAVLNEIAEASADGAECVYCAGGISLVDIVNGPDPCPRCLALAESSPHEMGLVPVHPHCFPPGTIVSGPRILAATERVYEGHLAAVVFASGDQVSVTPNHPVLTRRGWVAAGLLKHGDDVLRASSRLKLGLDHPDYEQAERRIENVAAALRETSAVVSARVPVAAEDFHGDGSPGHDVDVVATAWRAELNADVVADEVIPDDPLVVGDDAAGAGLGLESQFLSACDAATGGSVGGGDLGLPVGWRDRRPVVLERIGLRPGRKASVVKHPLDSSPADAMPESESLNGRAIGEVIHQSRRCGEPLPVLEKAARLKVAVQRSLADSEGGAALADTLSGLIGSDRVVECRLIEWSGHVYNLETISGWYLADGIVAHNCECAEIPRES